MTILKKLMIAGLVMAPLTVAAQAADLAPEDTKTDLPSFYVRGDAGWSFLNTDGYSKDSSRVIGGGFGYQFNDYLRADVTADWSGNYTVAPGAKISTTTLLGNAYLDYANDSMFTPYVGAGLGYGWVEGKGGIADDSGIAFGAAAGVAVDLTQNLAVDVGYRFRDVAVSGKNPLEHQATVGMRFKF